MPSRTTSRSCRPSMRRGGKSRCSRFCETCGPGIPRCWTGRKAARSGEPTAFAHAAEGGVAAFDAVFAMHGDAEVGGRGDFIDGDLADHARWRARRRGGRRDCWRASPARDLTIHHPCGPRLRRRVRGPAACGSIAIRRRAGRWSGWHPRTMASSAGDQFTRSRLNCAPWMLVLMERAVESLGVDCERSKSMGLANPRAGSRRRCACPCCARRHRAPWRDRHRRAVGRKSRGLSSTIGRGILAGILHGGDFRWAGAGEAAEFKRVVVGGEHGGFVEALPVGGDFDAVQIGELAVPGLFERIGLSRSIDGFPAFTFRTTR
jgi:hypothetical protein